MKVIEALNEKHAEKLSYYMSKADQVEKEHDRQRVLIQITQNLSGRINNSHAFKLPTIYLPNEQNSSVNIPNALSEVCEDIDKAIRLTVQKNLTAMKDDCARIDRKVVEVLEEDKLKRAENVKRSMRGAALLALSWVLERAISPFGWTRACSLESSRTLEFAMRHICSFCPRPP